jgi:hypothetical protein
LLSWAKFFQTRGQKSRAEFQRRSVIERVIRLGSFRCELSRMTIPSATAAHSNPAPAISEIFAIASMPEFPDCGMGELMAAVGIIPATIRLVGGAAGALVGAVDAAAGMFVGVASMMTGGGTAGG